jgi:DNA polymerase III epsilon subunit-like protein
MMSADSKLIIYIDVETTGISAARDRITQLAAIAVLYESQLETSSDCKLCARRRKCSVASDILEEFSSYVNTSYPISADASRITGITKKTISGAPNIASVLTTFFAWVERLRAAAQVQNVYYIAHNGNSLDFPMIEREMVRCNMNWPTTYSSFSFDTLLWARQFSFKHLSSRTIKSIINDIDPKFAFMEHDALGDCSALKLICDTKLCPTILEYDSRILYVNCDTTTTSLLDVHLDVLESDGDLKDAKKATRAPTNSPQPQSYLRDSTYGAFDERTIVSSEEYFDRDSA